MTSATWKRDFASGLIVIMPLLVTAFILVYLYNRLRGIPLPVENPLLRVALAIVVFILLVFSVGYLMRTTFGDFIEAWIDDIMNRLPGLRVVYNASKMAVETAVAGTDELQEPVKIETWQGLRMTAFKTGKRTEDGRDVLFIPTAPNITTGFVVEVDPENYERSGESVEDALTRVLSAGFGDAEDKPIPVDIEEATGEEAGANASQSQAEASETGYSTSDGDAEAT